MHTGGTHPIREKKNKNRRLTGGINWHANLTSPVQREKLEPAKKIEKAEYKEFEPIEKLELAKYSEFSMRSTKKKKKKKKKNGPSVIPKATKQGGLSVKEARRLNLPSGKY